ncbi:MAG TPA: YggS family pyridoxal phosphate-dependent enzyme, partial [Dehalococcoidia bacterium]|nr:YggS family pyridoxal phosphate-dependent enzyme [Dehalococcoidia bacterium]
IGVSKTFPAEAVIAAVAAGLSDIGENRVQEATPKAAAATEAGAHPTWHLIGHLQTNKVKPALELFSCIHSVDTLHLAEALSRHAKKPVEILLEVNVAGEVTKTGYGTADVVDIAPAIAALPNLVIRGLMTVAPETGDPEDVRPVFRELRQLNERLGLSELSMGMSGDYEVAIGEGATMVRIGRAIFGPRP